MEHSDYNTSLERRRLVMRLRVSEAEQKIEAVTADYRELTRQSAGMPPKEYRTRRTQLHLRLMDAHSAYLTATANLEKAMLDPQLKLFQ
jgi:hypothetical protein